MARIYGLLGLLFFALVGCAPVSFDSASVVEMQSCADGVDCSGVTPPDVNEPVDSSLKVTAHYLNEPTSPAAQFVNTQDITVTLETKIPKPFQMILSSDSKCAGAKQAFASVVPAYTLPGTSGTQNIYAQVFSETANLSTPCELASVFLDKNSPVILNPNVVIGRTAKDSIEISFDAQDSESGLVSLMCSTKAQDSAKTDCKATIASDTKSGTGAWSGNLPDGSYILYITAKDKAGNETKDFQVAISKDTTPPVLTWVDTALSEVAALPYELRFKYSDGPGSVPKAFQCLNTSGVFVNCTVKTADAVNNIYTLSYPFPANASVNDGPQVMGVKAQDQSNLWSNDLKANFNLDRSQPSIQLAPIANYIITSSLTAPFTATSAGVPYSFTTYKCELIQNNVVISTQNILASPCQLNGLTQNDPLAPYTLRVTGTKGAKTAQDQKTFSVDMTPPQLQILKKASNPTKQSISIFQVSAADPQSGLKSLVCVFNRATGLDAYVPCSDKIDFNSPALNDGTHKFEVFAEDQAGHKSSASYSWLIDLTPPVNIRVTAPSPLTSNPRPTFEFVAVTNTGAVDSSVDPATGYKCTLDSYSPMVACSSPWNLPGTFSNLADGSHKFYVQATDKSGNLSPVVVYDFVVDTTAPLVKIFPKVSDAIIMDSTTVHFQADETVTNIMQVICTVDGSPVACNVSGLGTKTVSGNIYVANPNPTNGTPRVVVIKAINQVNLTGQAQDTWNVNLGINPFAKLKPALAVSQTRCIFCHTSMTADLITDNGGSYGSLTFAPGGDWGTAAWNPSDYEHGQWASLRSGLSSSIINGTIFYQNRTYNSQGITNLNAWANWGLADRVANEHGNQIIPRKFIGLPANPLTTLTDFLKLVTAYRSPEEMQAIKVGASAGFPAKVAMPGSTLLNPLQTKLQEVQNLKIGAPTKAEIISKIPSGRDFYYIPDNPNLSPKEAELLLGLKLIAGATPYYKVQGDLACDGDLMINRSVLLKAVNLKTRRGCRIYATGPIFVEAVTDRSAPTKGITYQDLSGEGLHNIQLTSASGISMGLGRCKFPIAATGTPANLCSLGYRSMNSFLTLKGTEIYQVATTVMVDGLGNTILEDAAYDPGAVSADFQMWVTDGLGNFTTQPRRQVSFDRILINAPVVHSRYSGNFTGSIIAGFLMPSVGSFSYTYDPVFQDTRVKVLPILDLKNILYFQ